MFDSLKKFELDVKNTSPIQLGYEISSIVGPKSTDSKETSVFWK